MHVHVTILYMYKHTWPTKTLLSPFTFLHAKLNEGVTCEDPENFSIGVRRIIVYGNPPPPPSRSANGQSFSSEVTGVTFIFEKLIFSLIFFCKHCSFSNKWNFIYSHNYEQHTNWNSCSHKSKKNITHHLCTHHIQLEWTGTHIKKYFS